MAAEARAPVFSISKARERTRRRRQILGLLRLGGPKLLQLYMPLEPKEIEEFLVEMSRHPA